MIDQQNETSPNILNYSLEALLKQHIDLIQSLLGSATEAGITPDQFNQLVHIESEKMTTYLNEENTRKNLALMEEYKKSNVFHEGSDNQGLPYLLLIAKEYDLNPNCFQGSRPGDVLITPKGIYWITSAEFVGNPSALEPTKITSYNLNEIIDGKLETPSEDLSKYLPYNSRISNILNLKTNETTPVAVVSERLDEKNRGYVASLIDFAKKNN